MRYEPVDGELELLPGLRLVPAPGHTRGMQVVVVETDGRPIVVGGDVAVWHGELDEPHTEGQLRVRALEPGLVWLAHEPEPWRPRTTEGAPPRRRSSPSRRQSIRSAGPMRMPWGPGWSRADRCLRTGRTGATQSWISIVPLCRS